MSNKSKDDKRDDEANECDVGYKKPPKETRFKKGQSGNPTGRPKGSKNKTTLLNDILNQKVQIREGGKSSLVSKYEAMVQAAAQKAMQGDARAPASLKSLAQLAELLTPQEQKQHPGGVIVLPHPISREEWEAQLLELHDRQIEDQKKLVESS